MRSVLYKLGEDLRSNNLQRFGIFLMLLLSTAALTTSLMVRARGGTAWEDLYNRSDGAHAWFYGDRAALETVAARSEVQDSMGPYPVARLAIQGINTPNNEGFPLWLEGTPGGVPDRYGPIVTDGRWYERAGEIVLSRTFARDYGFEPGDTIALRNNDGGVSELTVSGVAVFAGRSPFSVPTLAWSSPETLAATSLSANQLSALGLRLADRAEAGAFAERMTQELGDNPFVVIEDWNDVRAQNDEATAIIILFLGIFSTFALISAAFVIVNAIGGRVLARYRDIGVMKALGFTPRQIAGGLLIEQCGVALLAAIAGVLLGTLLVPLLDEPASREFETTSFGYFKPDIAVAILAGVVGLVAIATAVPALRAGRVPVVRAITTGFGRTAAKPSRVSTIAGKSGLPAWAALGIGDAFERPLRAWLTVAALVLAVVTVTFVASSEWTLRRLYSDSALIGEPFDLTIEGMEPGTEEYLRSQPEVEAMFTRNETVITPEGKPEQVHLVALGPGFERVNWVVSGGRLFEAPGEAIAGQGFLDLMDVRVGDTVTVQVLGKSISVKIVGQFRATEDSGRWLMTSLETARQQLGVEVEAGGLALRLKDSTRSSALAREIRVAFPATRQIEVWDHRIDGGSQVRGVLACLAALLLLVGVVSLVNTITTGVRERRRDLGVFKVVGFTPRQVAGSVVAGAAVLAVISVLIGIPLGLWVSFRISDQIGANLGWGPGLIEMPPATWFAAIAPVVILVATLAALVPAANAARTSVSAVLRSD